MMLNNRGGYLQQVTMIESQCQPKRKVTGSMIHPIQKSPLRDRESNYPSYVDKMNLANVGVGMGVGVGNTPNRGGKTSLSPLRSRRTESSLSVRSGFGKKKQQVVPYCTNEPHKLAKFVTYSEEQTLYYCQKCAILLASQGFSVSRISPGQSYEEEYNPRKEEIDEFMYDLENILQLLGRKLASVTSTVKHGNDIYEEQLTKVDDYYGQFYEVINEHKRRVIAELKEEFEAACAPIQEISHQVGQALKDSKAMKDDIVDSMNAIIYETDEASFRPIMVSYKQKLQKYKGLGNSEQAKVQLRKLQFRDAQTACRALEQGLHVEWQSDKNNMNYFSKQSQAENPVEAIETAQKFPKNSLKELGNLFCSFEE